MSKSKVSLSDFLSKVEEIVSLNPSYRSGGSGADGTCDCIGLVIGAVRRAGGAWPGLHGSNYAARNETESLAEIRSASDLSAGELVYKHYVPGQKGYDLPSRYRNGKDLNDYYHVGLVTSVRPLRITHMTSPRALTDTRLGAWSHHGWCRRVSMPSGPQPATPADPAAPSAVPSVPAAHSVSEVSSSLPAETVALILQAAAVIEEQLDVIYESIGGRG